MAKSDGSTASYYELPPNATELQDLISYKNMNAQMGEIQRAVYRYGEADHSEKLRDINKIIFYAQAEKKRLLRYELEQNSTSEQSDKQYRGISKGTQADIKCTGCEKLFEPKERIYYQGNEPKCKKCAGED